MKFLNIFFHIQYLFSRLRKIRNLYGGSPLEVRAMTLPGINLFRPSFAFKKHHKNTIVCLEDNVNQVNIRADLLIQGLVENPEIWAKIDEARVRFLTEREGKVSRGEWWYKISEF